MVLFKDYIFDLFPFLFRRDDTYIVDGKGLFQRYIETLSDEWDQELSDKLEEVWDITDVLTTEEKYIAHLAWFLNNPPDMLYSDARYRKLLRYVIDINKCKGTVRSYEMIFFLLGLNVTLTFIPLTTMVYDNAELNYDEEELRYDSECPSCSEYDLAILDPDGNQPDLAEAVSHPENATAPILALLGAIIKYVEPINLRLRELTYEGDPVPLNWVLTTGTWDDSLLWADQKIYRDTP